jgi:hypothetical protein
MGRPERKGRELGTWHDLLKQIIEDPQQKQRITQELRIHPLTLARWAKKETKPSQEHMRHLLGVIPPGHLDVFTQLASVDFPGLARLSDVSGSSSQEPPSAFYAHVLSACAQTPGLLWPDGVYNLILQQAIEHLNPDHSGMAISIVKCMPPIHGTHVRSLREIAGIGMPPWKRELEQKMAFLGAESLAGEAVTKSRLVVIQSREAPLSLVHRTAHEQSAVACPITRKAKIMGCLLVASERPNYFTRTHLALVERYADLTAVAFEPEDFYESQDIELRLMPRSTIQQPYLHDYRRRVTQKLVEATAVPRYLTLYKAQQQVWQEIEEELLQLPLSMEENHCCNL